jgi:phage terminase large subunit-like protein
MKTSDTVIAWIESHCRIPKGPKVGDPVVLLEYQRAILRGIFDTPTRRAIISFGRQNAKTTLAAYLALFYLAGPLHQRNGLIVSTALTKEQASILFDTAAKVVRQSPELAAVVAVVDHQKTLRCLELGTEYRALSSDAPSQLGLSPYLAIHDELGQVRGPFSALFDAVESGSGVQTAPLSIIISTQAAGDNDLLSRLIDDAETGEDPTTKLFLWTAPMELDPYSDAAIRAANPAFDHFMNQAEVRGQAEQARRLPSMQGSFENLILNRRIDATSRFISRELWVACGDSPGSIDGKALHCGLDASSAHDLFAFVGVDESGGVHTYAWLPAEGLAEKSRQDKTPWDEWAKTGYLLTTPGRAIDFDFVAARMREIFDRANVKVVAFDRAYMRFLRPALARAKFTDEEMARFVDHGQGFMGMAPAIRELEVRLLQKKLKHGNNPVLTTCADNARVDTDPAGSRKFSKKRSTGRIDALVALAMACGAGPLLDTKPEPQYQVFFV